MPTPKLHELSVMPTGTPTKLKFGESTGDRYRVRAIAEGDGSSGHYGGAMLKRDFPAALPEGSRMRANHDGLCENGGDIRRIIGRTISTPEWQEASDDGPAGEYVDILVSEQWSDFVREFGDTIGLSISMAGEYEPTPEDWHEEGAELVKYADDGSEVGRRKRDIIRLASAQEYPYNSLDFVEAPGADGRILAALESARHHLPELNLREAAAFAGTPGDRIIAEHKITEAAPPRGTEEDEVDEATLARHLAESQEKTLAAVKEMLAENAAPEPAPKPTLEQTAESVVAAGLTEWGRKAVYAAVERGEDMAEAITNEKAREAAISEHLDAKRGADVQYGFVTEAGESQGIEGDVESGLELIERATGRKR